MYLEEQAWFLNCVVVARTDLGAAALLALLKEIERRVGRGRAAERNAPRVIDMDILFYGDAVISGPSLEVPHPRLAERAFVLVPLNDVRPRLVHPLSGKTVGELLEALKTEKKVVERPGALAGLSPSPPRQP